MQSILIVDDMESIHEMLDTVVQPAGHTTIYAQDGEQAISLYKEKCPDLVLTDLKMEPMDGLELIQRLREIDPNAIVIVMTGFADTENAIASLKLGAFDYLTKPFKLDQLMSAINRADKQREVMIAGDSHRSNFALIGDSVASRNLREAVNRVSESKSPALIKGPKGTEKNLVASAIHASGHNIEENEKPFESIDCAEHSHEELSSYLIGPDGCGGEFVANAAGGTLLLENIDHLPFELQSELNSVVRNGKGETRFLFTTTANLDDAVAEGVFDESLFYRISTHCVDCPALEKRLEDIPLFAKSVLQGLGEDSLQISQDAQRLLQNYMWPGNFSEFRQVIENATADSSNDTIDASNLPDCIRETNQWRSLADYLEAASKEYKARILSACQGDHEKAASILGCDPSEVS